MIREEHKASSKCERVCILRSILAQSPTYYKTDSKKRTRSENILKAIHIKWNLAMSYIFNGKFEGNILVVGRTGCGKTGFVQNLAVNKFFGELAKAEWVSYIKLGKQREAELQSCFDTSSIFIIQQTKNSLNIFWNI